MDQSITTLALKPFEGEEDLYEQGIAFCRTAQEKGLNMAQCFDRFSYYIKAVYNEEHSNTAH